VEYHPQQGYYIAYFPLRTQTTMGGVSEFMITNIKDVAKFLAEGKIVHRGIFLILAETPGIGHPFGGAAGADQNNGTADLRKDVSGMTDQIVFLRSALVNHLKAEDNDWMFFTNAATVEEATARLVDMLLRLPQARNASPDAIKQTAQQLARVYWGH
jgi:hypothetical protein